MIKHKLFAKGEKIHALISTTQKPNVLFPVRAIIYDVKFDDINPQYQIKVLKFYDQIYFLAENTFKNRPTKLERLVNNGFDDEEGYYRIQKGDHIAYRF